MCPSIDVSVKYDTHSEAVLPETARVVLFLKIFSSCQNLPVVVLVFERIGLGAGIDKNFARQFQILIILQGSCAHVKT